MYTYINTVYVYCIYIDVLSLIPTCLVLSIIANVDNSRKENCQLGFYFHSMYEQGNYDTKWSFYFRYELAIQYIFPFLSSVPVYFFVHFSVTGLCKAKWAKGILNALTTFWYRNGHAISNEIGIEWDAILSFVLYCINFFFGGWGVGLDFDMSHVERILTLHLSYLFI